MRVVDRIHRASLGMKDGETGVGLMAAGQSVGLIHDVPTVKELVDRIIGEAREIVGDCLARMTA